MLMPFARLGVAVQKPGCYVPITDREFITRHNEI